MKKSLMFFIGLCLSVQMFGQKIMDSGFIKMEMIEATSEDEQMAMGLEMLKGTETNYYFNKERSLVTQSMMGGMVEIATMTNKKENNIELFFNMMGNKTLVETTEDEMRKNQEGQQVNTDNMKIEYDRTDTKEIAGYKCYKATITNPEIKENSMTISMYVSDEITASNKMIQTLNQFDLKGFPLEFAVNMENMKMVYSTTQIEKEFDASVFDFDKSGYQKLTMAEFQKQMGAMGGGMGF